MPALSNRAANMTSAFAAINENFAGTFTTLFGGGRAEYDVGVAACDEWLRKFGRCMREKLADAARKQMLEALLETAKTWRQTAATPEGRIALETPAGR